MASRKYTAEFLRPIVAASHSISEVIRRVGVPTNGGNHRNISAAIRRAGLDTSHFGSRAHLKFASIGVEQMEELVRTSLSFAQVLTKLGLPLDGRPHHDLKRYLTSRNYDTSHFRGSAWSRGDTKDNNPALARISAKASMPDSVLFVENGPLLRGRPATRRLLALGWAYRCAICGLGDRWQDQELVLHVYHINGINNDNRLINLRFLCPNCHSQTPTYCNRAREEDLLAQTWSCYRGSLSRAWRNWSTRGS